MRTQVMITLDPPGSGGHSAHRWRRPGADNLGARRDGWPTGGMPGPKAEWPARKWNGCPEVDMTAVFALDACRTPVGKIKGSLAAVRPDHLTAEVISAMLARNPWLDPAQVDDVYWGAANQAGEDNRNVARMGFCWRACPWRCPGRP